MVNHELILTFEELAETINALNARLEDLGKQKQDLSHIFTQQALRKAEALMRIVCLEGDLLIAEGDYEILCNAPQHDLKTVFDH